MVDLLITQAADQWVWVLRILAAGILGCFIGFERRNRFKIAGIRTHAIVALGAALMMVVSKYGFYDVAVYDASRVAAQIVSGVGFLGVGIIFVRNNTEVSGLTTAAGIWATAGVGMSMGAGQYFVSVVSAFLIIGLQVLLHRIRFLSQEAYPANLKIVVKNTEDGAHRIENFVQKEKIEIKTIKINKADKTNIKMELEVVFPGGYDRTDFINRLAGEENVLSVRG